MCDYKVIKLVLQHFLLTTKLNINNILFKVRDFEWLQLASGCLQIVTVTESEHLQLDKEM
jgi:hypothetical protein